MPRAASKFRNTDKTTVFATQTDRNDDAIINKNASGQFYYGGNEIYLKPAIKGTTFMSLSTPRQTVQQHLTSAGQKSFYTDFLNSQTSTKSKKGFSFAT